MANLSDFLSRECDEYQQNDNHITTKGKDNSLSLPLILFLEIFLPMTGSDTTYITPIYNKE